MNDAIINEMVVLIARETGWSLEYIRGLPLTDLLPFYEELKYQRAIEDYNLARNFAMVIANWASANSRSRRFKVEDFIGSPPERPRLEKEANLWEIAKEKGIEVPQQGT